MSIVGYCVFYSLMFGGKMVDKTAHVTIQSAIPL